MKWWICPKKSHFLHPCEIKQHLNQATKSKDDRAGRKHNVGESTVDSEIKGTQHLKNKLGKRSGHWHVTSGKRQKQQHQKNLVAFFSFQMYAVRRHNDQWYSNGKSISVYDKPQYGWDGCYVVQSADTLFIANMHTQTIKSSITSKMCHTFA